MRLIVNVNALPKERKAMTTKHKGKPPLQSVEVLLGNNGQNALQGLVREALEQIL